MSDRLDQLLALVPAGVTPEDVIDLVDGRLPAARERQVIDAIARQPRLGALVKQMRDDRDGMQALGTLHAPAGLLTSIESRLQAEALRELAQAEANTNTEIPVSTIEHASPNIYRVLVESAFARRFAVAASLLIVAGLGAFGMRELLRSGTVNWPYGITRQSASNTTDNLPEANPAPLPTPEPAAIAKAAPESTTPSTTPAQSPSESPLPITLARARELAGEGRLAIVVRVLDPKSGETTAKHVETVARAAGLGREGPWTALNTGSLPAAYAALLTPALDVPGLPTPSARPAPEQPTVASDSPGQPRPPAVEQQQPTPPKLIVRAMYTVDLVPGERAIDGVLKSLSPADSSAHVAFRALPEPMFVELSAQPQNVLWWTSAPSNWVKTQRVPVIIETVE